MVHGDYFSRSLLRPLQQGNEENTISSLAAAQLTPPYMLLTPNSSEATQHF